MATYSNNANLSHAHIRVLPRPERENNPGDSSHSEWTPTYCSSSLLCASPVKRQTQSTGRAAVDSSAEVTTFAEMARRYCHRDNEVESEQSVHSPTSIAGIIKLQPNRGKGQHLWRPLQPPDLVEPDSGSEWIVDSSVPQGLNHHMHGQSPLPGGPTPFLSFPPSSQNRTITETWTAEEQPPVPFVHMSSRRQSFSLQHTDDEISVSGAHTARQDDYSKLFGNLPDPIRLHEQTGEFDGQVVFIAHPNRDVSAHQWSSMSFQWENIGRYACSRGRLEGSLASDVLKDQNVSRNSLAYFKLAAESREKLVVSNGWPKRESGDTPPPEITSTIQLNRVSTTPGLIRDNHAAGAPRNANSTKPYIGLAPSKSTSGLSYVTVRHKVLEDPFVTDVKSCATHVFATVPAGIDGLDTTKGLLNREYEFPVISATSPELATKLTEEDTCRQLLARSRREPSNLVHCGARVSDRTYESTLREVTFGEEASIRNSLGHDQANPVHDSLVATSSESYTARRKLEEPPVTFDDHIRHLSLPSQGHVTLPRFEGLQPTARSLFPPLGPTVANPHRTVPRQDRTGPDCTGASLPITYASSLQVPARCRSSKQHSFEFKDPEPQRNRPMALAGCHEPRTQLLYDTVFEADTSIISATDTANLKSSDPDSAPQVQDYEIANGLGQQAPTPQNFKGPFFKESMPTAHDPTVSLSVDISEQEKLTTWFRDGHRPARQREYATTLVSAATADRKGQGFGVIGHPTATRNRRHERYGNTAPFVRLYEGFSEYIDEYHKGSGGSYFTRAWTVAAPQLRELGPDGNSSFYDGMAVHSEGLR